MKTTKKYTIAAHMTNPDGFASLRNIAGLMFDVGIYQGDEVEKNLGLENLHRVYRNWEIEIIKPLKLHDKVEVDTFATGFDKFLAYRNFSIRRGGETVVKAYCLFLKLNEKKRIARLPKSLIEAYGTEESIYDGRGDFTYTEDFEKVVRVQIRKTDIDNNYHVNNTAYFDLISEAVDIKAQDVAYINIVYKKEIPFDLSYVEIGSRDFGDHVDYKIFREDEIFSLGKIVKRNV